MLRSKANVAVLAGMLLIAFALIHFTTNSGSVSQRPLIAAEKYNAGNGQQTTLKIFKLEHADAEELLLTIMPLFEGFSETRTVIVYNKRLNMIIARGSESELKILEALVIEMDVAPKAVRAS